MERYHGARLLLFFYITPLTANAFSLSCRTQIVCQEPEHTGHRPLSNSGYSQALAKSMFTPLVGQHNRQFLDGFCADSFDSMLILAYCHSREKNDGVQQHCVIPTRNSLTTTSTKARQHVSGERLQCRRHRSCLSAMS